MRAIDHQSRTPVHRRLRRSVAVTGLRRFIDIALPLNDAAEYQAGPPFPIYEFQSSTAPTDEWIAVSGRMRAVTMLKPGRNIWLQDLPK
jgi:hypothetical protein